MSEIKINLEHSKPKPKKMIGFRHFQFVLLFLIQFVFFGMRTSLSVAIISMTEESPPSNSISTYPQWDNTDTILSSFFWGYIIPQVVAGQLSERYGPKWFFVVTMIAGSIINIAIPTMAQILGSTGVIICRVLQGICQAFMYPGTHNLLSQWTPVFERSLVANFVYGGASLGIAVCMPVTGAISGSEMGWPVAFYIYGGLGIATAIIFIIWGENSPSDSTKISKDEQKYIEANTDISSGKKFPTPWKSILRSVPVYAMLVAGISQCWGCFTLLTEIPTYLSNIMNFDINSNSQLSALPYFAQFFVGLFISPLADFIAAKNIVTISTSRKIFNSLASYLPAAALIYLAFLENFETNLVITLLVITVSTSQFAQSGYWINLIDIAPNHSATLLGMVNGTNNIFSLLAPLTVGFLGSDKKDPILWRKVFLLAAVIYAVCGTFYVIFTSAEVQKWNNIEEDDEESDKGSVIIEKEKKTEFLPKC
ncbi:putative inorganic phosphate cotransporter [Tribolium madens]|uniref:putative inorganic phosphate cotransporter n=1 Tax=Tribolium madens TaxID=41895 RepID=UPI001CF745FE|nr:putative inorganic phosphate cotransporter [Tribolium madens]